MRPGSFPILFITATRIGDAVLSSGLIRKLQEEIPNASFTVVAGPDAAPLFEDIPRLDEVIVLEKSSRGGHWVALWNKVRLETTLKFIYLRQREDDPVIRALLDVLHGTWVSAPAVAAAPA